MKKISFEEAIKAVNEKKRVYVDEHTNRFWQRDDEGVLCWYEDYALDEYNANLTKSGHEFFTPEEPKSFGITETGLYKTRGGKKVYITKVTGGSSWGVITGNIEISCWKNDGRLNIIGTLENDITGKWGDDE